MSDQKMLLPKRNFCDEGKKKSEYFAGVFGIPFAIVIGIVLLLMKGDCRNPIRLWLEVNCLQYTILGFFSILDTFTNIFKRVYKLFLVFIVTCYFFQLIWYILGSIWVFTDNECASEWYFGYLLSSILITFFFIGGSFVLCFSLCFFLSFKTVFK